MYNISNVSKHDLITYVPKLKPISDTVWNLNGSRNASAQAKSFPVALAFLMFSLNQFKKCAAPV